MSRTQDDGAIEAKAALKPSGGNHLVGARSEGYSANPIRPTENSVNYPVKAPQFAENQANRANDVRPSWSQGFAAKHGRALSAY